MRLPNLIKVRSGKWLSPLSYTENITMEAPMSTQEIIQALTDLPPADQLKIAETALQHLQQNRQSLTKEQRRQQMEIAAIAALDDYSTNSELTAFTALDGEDFYEECEQGVN
ncbi:MAG: hypothetical protein HC852_17260 [Acaryochloridaceae cyanobacterium RU_4_10]|nr:hypothetical protein [Acaryochloridaceae cyanobacterium RU_4_10]